jgi:pyridoxamine 5'-phosphate oxidase
MARKTDERVHAWAVDLDALRDEVWARLVRGVHDARAPARRPTLATVSPAGRPEARTVVLRGADQSKAEVVIHTDVRSPKIASLRQTPFAALHVWDASAHLQLRLDARATILTGEAVQDTWERLSAGTRQSYGVLPVPGQPIAESLAYSIHADASCFAVVRLEVQAIDAVHLGPNHRRARFERESRWAGCWLAP